MQLTYAYLGESLVEQVAAGDRVALATSGGPAAHPFFYSGFLVRPRLNATLLLSVSKVAGSRFFTPPSMRDAVIRAADPVVTSDGERLRFEAFSACTGVYCRADLLGSSLDAGFVSAGTTNVDFNPPMRNALAQLRDADAAHLSIGAEGVTLATLDRHVTEKKVAMPGSWLRSFAEVQLVQVSMVPRFDLDGMRTKRFLSTLARTKRRGVWWAVPAAEGLALDRHPRPGAVRVAGLERLHLLANHARHAAGLRLWSTAVENPATAWELDLPGTRLTLVLSPDVSRGFSGEGAVLRDLVDGEILDLADRLRPLVRERSRLDPYDLGAQTDADATSVRRALHALAASGVVGYDLSGGHFFFRELPFSLEAMATLHPRLRNARALGSQAVTVIECNSDGVMAAVRGTSATYIVRVVGEKSTCTCPWYERHGSSRGPCKHVLALNLAMAQLEPRSS